MWRRRVDIKTEQNVNLMSSWIGDNYDLVEQLVILADRLITPVVAGYLY